MEVAVLVMSILGLIFGLSGFAAATVALVMVKGWQHSTHRISYAPVQETRYEVDAPPEVVDQLASPPEKLTPEQYLRKVQNSSLDELYEGIET